MALETDGVVLVRRPLPFRAGGLVGIMAIDAAELRVAAAAHRIGVFDGIPRGHAGRKLRAFARVASATRPVDVVVRTAGVGWRAGALHEQMRAARKETRSYLTGTFYVLLAAQMARLTTYA